MSEESNKYDALFEHHSKENIEQEGKKENLTSSEESKSDIYLDKLNTKVIGLQGQLEENYKKKEEIIAEAASLFGVSVDELKSKLPSKWLAENKTSDWYGFGKLNEQNEQKYYTLMSLSTELFKQNEKLGHNMQWNQTSLDFVKSGLTEGGKDKLSNDLSSPRNVETVTHLDDLLESGILSEEEVIDNLNKRVDRIYKVFGSTEMQNWQGPRGDTPEYESQLELKYISKDVVEKIKNSPKSSEKLKTALALATAA
ncbi:MAG: hypothetical protein KBD52_03690 [Candidatus Pacebacteria bacterium]|nr:hypothetical protein [Candidatus Paceibacterota bacterium]